MFALPWRDPHRPSFRSPIACTALALCVPSFRGRETAKPAPSPVSAVATLPPRYIH
jgi:hypothetical protein